MHTDDICMRSRYYTERKLNESNRLEQISALSAHVKNFMMSRIKEHYKIAHGGAALNGFYAIDGIVKHNDEFMLLAVFPEQEFSLGHISAQMNLSGQLSKQGNVLHKALVFTLTKKLVVEYDANAAYLALDDYSTLSAMDEPPARTDGEYCAYCDHYDLCIGNNMPVISCESCAAKGSPICQRCANEELHIFHPCFITNTGYSIESVDQENMVIEYDGFYSSNNKTLRMTNKEKPVLTSAEFKKVWANKMTMDDPFIKLMAKFNATIDMLEVE